MDKLQKVFVTEAEELVADLERALLAFEKDMQSKTSVQEIFRVMHTLKGSASMFGFEKLSELTHDLETIYDGVRREEIKASDSILEITLESVDHIKSILSDPELKDRHLSQLHADLVKRIKTISLNSENVLQQPPTPTEGTVQTYYIFCKPAPSIFRNGTNPLFLIDDLCNLGETIVIPHLDQVPSLADINADQCYTSFEVLLATSESESIIKEVFIFVEDAMEVTIERVAEGNVLREPALTEALTFHQSGETATARFGLQNVLRLVKSKTSSIEKEIVLQKERKEPTSSIRVSSDKLDELMNLVSELVTSQARLNLLTQGLDISELTVVSETMEKITKRLRDNAFNICLVPIESLVIRFQRLVRDLAVELGKEVEFVTEGTETELDRSIIEKVTDPILHILRNCIDHGIEIPDERTRNGKPGKGTIHFRAFHSGTSVFIQVEDNGKGIDPTVIRRKAIDKGIIAADANISDKDVLNLIFAPGFSTAEKITDVSGRGVGMDIVKRNIESIHGEVSVDSVVAKGTTILIKLPLTLSILDGMLVKVGSAKYLLPLSSIQTCYEIESVKLSVDVAQKHAFDGELLPVFNLHSVFDCEEQRQTITQVIKVHYDGFPVGLSVDGIIGEYQAVMKPLGDLYKDRDEFSGATILGDGSVALVVDTTTLVRQLIRQETFAIYNN